MTPISTARSESYAGWRDRERFLELDRIIAGEAAAPPKEERRGGRARGISTLTAARYRLIAAAAAAGARWHEIQERFGVAHNTIARALRWAKAE